METGPKYYCRNAGPENVFSWALVIVISNQSNILIPVYVPHFPVICFNVLHYLVLTTLWSS